MTKTRENVHSMDDRGRLEERHCQHSLRVRGKVHRNGEDENTRAHKNEGHVNVQNRPECQLVDPHDAHKLQQVYAVSAAHPEQEVAATVADIRRLQPVAHRLHRHIHSPVCAYHAHTS